MHRLLKFKKIFRNNMEIKTKKLADSKVKLQVVLNKEELIDFVKEAEKLLANQIRVEGFRPGKVPHDLVRKNIGPEKIKEEALNIALRSSFSDAIAKEKFDVINQTDFKILKNTPECLEYEMILSIFPEVILGKYTGLDVEKNTISVTDGEIQKTLDELARMRAVTKPVERPAEKGDKVEVDFEIFQDGKLIDGGKSENHPLIIGEKQFIPGFEEEIIGLNSGDNKTFTIKTPADYHQKEIAGKEIKIELKLKKVEEYKIPEINDQFAINLGRFKSLQELKNNLKKSLEMEKENKEKERVRLEILNEIVKKSIMEIPSVLIDERLDSLIHEFDQELHEKDMELGLYLAHLKKTQDDLRKDWRPKAEAQVKMSLVARAIAKQEKISISDDEIEKEFAVLADHYTRQGMLEQLQQSDPISIKSRIKDVLLNEKVFDFLEKSNETK
jgi:trigger factor